MSHSQIKLRHTPSNDQRQMSSQHLNDRQYRFAELVVEGVPAGRAYEQAGYKARGASADVEASKTLRKPKIKKMIEELREDAREEAKLSRDELVGMLVKIIKSPPERAAMDNPLCEVRMARGEPYAVFPDKARCIDKLIQILGFDAESYDQSSTRPLRIVIGGNAEDTDA